MKKGNTFQDTKRITANTQGAGFLKKYYGLNFSNVFLFLCVLFLSLSCSSTRERVPTLLKYKGFKVWYCYECPSSVNAYYMSSKKSIDLKSNDLFNMKYIEDFQTIDKYTVYIQFSKSANQKYFLKKYIRRLKKDSK